MYKMVFPSLDILHKAICTCVCIIIMYHISVCRRVCTVCTCVGTPADAQTGFMHMCKSLCNECPCSETSVCAPPKSRCTSKRLCNVSSSTKIMVYADLRSVLMLSALSITYPRHEALDKYFLSP